MEENHFVWEHKPNSQNQVPNPLSRMRSAIMTTINCVESEFLLRIKEEVDLIKF